MPLFHPAEKTMLSLSGRSLTQPFLKKFSLIKILYNKMLKQSTHIIHSFQQII